MALVEGGVLVIGISRVDLILVLLVIPRILLGIKHALVNVGMGSLTILEIACSEDSQNISVGSIQIFLRLRSSRNLVLDLLPVIITIIHRRHIDELQTAPLAGDNLTRGAFDENTGVLKNKMSVTHAPNVVTVDRNGRNVAHETTALSIVRVGLLSAVTNQARVKSAELLNMLVEGHLGVLGVNKFKLLLVSNPHSIFERHVHRRAVKVVVGGAHRDEHGDGTAHG